MVVKNVVDIVGAGVDPEFDSDETVDDAGFKLVSWEVNPDEAENADDDPLHSGEGLVDKDVDISQASLIILEPKDKFKMQDKSIKPTDAELEDIQIHFTIRMNDLYRHHDCKLFYVLHNLLLERRLSNE
ncbi:hypothetical protein GIB67_016442 [Kingdonia uniflora]|uniref:Uncharacterized protein n=1 Tax=Kingdonia uniflora TaxID=39325 RepID=A0A7J7MHC9_9MAGN|nr:hypothetical protein GIB67_016442 [Kingdonia uniflora]